ncbi:hypothetical protein SAMN04489730_6499 [Amycolatopsis australiensis]|uniref:Neutral/alkaline non-lysosomal ceramidase, N-terminal n=2 Tax=Amycolatopsis australiensis TaxID=546364 RepID=A0A1K1SR46_9PSEU|nr:hypothetical protein SAMN04489730_6499 [Amycolatopsis australiensis]
MVALTAVMTTAEPAQAQPAAAMAMSVGTLDVTPQTNPWMGGYGWVPRGNAAHVVARKLRAHCAVIYDNGVPNILLRVDVVSIPRSVHQRIRSGVLEAGLVDSSSDFLLAASHTHSGPLVGDRPDPGVLLDLAPADAQVVADYTDLYVDALVDLVRRTRAAAATAVSLHYAEGQADIATNRDGLPYLLPTVPVLLARRIDNGNPFAVLFGHACHPVCRGNDTVYDSDHCGYASEAVERALGVPALFFQGTAGDLNPATLGSDSAVAGNGSKLANAVLDVVQRGTFQPVAGPIGTTLTEIQLPMTVDTSDPAARAQLRARYQYRVDNISPTTDNAVDAAARRHAELIIGQIDAGSVPTSVPMPIQCWKLGGLTILALGNEVLSGYDIGLHRLGVSPLWVMAYANEVNCYVPSDEVSWAGLDRNNGYEAGWNTWWDGDEYIAGVGTSMIAYDWPAPLRSSPPGTQPASPDSTEGILMAACRSVLGA